MANVQQRNEKELKKAEERGDLNKDQNWSDRSAADSDSSVGFENENRVENQFIRDGDGKKTTGREISHINAPEVSLTPTSSDSSDKNKSNWKTQADQRLMVDNAFIPREDKNWDSHPFLDMERDQGMFLPNRQGMTTDDMLEQINKEIFQIKNYSNLQERDINGDTILESIIVEERKRNDDGTVQLMNGQPVVGALRQNRPKMNLLRNWVAYPVVKDSEIGEGTNAPEDGVIIIRVA